MQVLCGPDLIAEGKVYEGQPLPPTTGKLENGVRPLAQFKGTHVNLVTSPSSQTQSVVMIRTNYVLCIKSGPPMVTPSVLPHNMYVHLLVLVCRH
jgi:hypothetical protein